MTSYAQGKCRNSAHKTADEQPSKGRFSGCRRALQEFGAGGERSNSRASMRLTALGIALAAE